jgi:hypothetical protein
MTSLMQAAEITLAEPLCCPKKASRDRPLHPSCAVPLRRILGIPLENKLKLSACPIGENS